MGLTWLTLLIGNLWAALDPWNTLRRLYGRFFDEPLSFNLPYPAVLASWPAVLLLMGFIWFELAWFQAQEAREVVNYFLMFTAWLWVGMIVFKPGQRWENANPFSRYFHVLGRFGPAEKRGAHVEVRIPGTALHATQLTHFSESIFVIVALFAVTFDGFVSTPEWWVLLRAMMLKGFEILPRSFGFPASFLFAIFAGVALFAGAYLLGLRGDESSFGKGHGASGNGGRFRHDARPHCRGLSHCPFYTGRSGTAYPTRAGYGGPPLVSIGTCSGRNPSVGKSHGRLKLLGSFGWSRPA